MAPEPQSPEAEVPERHENTGIATWAVAGVGLGTLLLLGLALGGLHLAYGTRLAAVQPPVPVHFPEPRLQSDPVGDLRGLQAAQREQVEGYDWVDRALGLARVPVPHAMEALAARGEAAWAPLEAPQPGIPLPVRPLAARMAEDGR